MKLIWLRKVLTSDHEWKSIIKASYPKELLLEQLGSSLPTEEDNLNTFGMHVFQAYAEFGRKIHLEKSEELKSQKLSSATILLRLERKLYITENGLTKVCVTLEIC